MKESEKRMTKIKHKDANAQRGGNLRANLQRRKTQKREQREDEALPVEKPAEKTKDGAA